MFQVNQRFGEDGVQRVDGVPCLYHYYEDAKTADFRDATEAEIMAQPCVVAALQEAYARGGRDAAESFEKDILQHEKVREALKAAREEAVKDARAKSPWRYRCLECERPITQEEQDHNGMLCPHCNPDGEDEEPDGQEEMYAEELRCAAEAEEAEAADACDEED